MALEISKYGDPVLARRAEEVTVFDEELHEFVEAMFETMYAAKGVGLAAPQVGVALRVFVMDCSSEERKAPRVVMVNPVILEAEGTQEGGEGCLSIPGFHADLARPDRVRVRGQRADGEWHELDVRGLEARCVAHECDHLDGKLFIERLGPLKRDMIRRKIRKLQKQGEW